MPDSYDAPWKIAITRYLREFMAFYFPAAHDLIDWEQACDFLDTELEQLAPNAAAGSRRADNLIRLCKIDGHNRYVLLHIEVQSRHCSDFAERVFLYNLRIFNQHRLPVASLAILADTNHGHQPGRFGYKLFGCEMAFTFPVISLRSYKLDELLLHTNPFALLTAAHIQTQRTRHQHAARYAAKWHLITLLYERNWPRERIMDFGRVVSWMMRLPTATEITLWQEINHRYKEFAMEYMLPFERVAFEKGKTEGRQLGQAELAESLLKRRFGTLPAGIQQRLREAQTEQLDAWANALFDAASLDDIFTPVRQA